MHTNIVIDDELIKEVMKRCKFRTKKEAVEFGLRLILQLDAQAKIKEFKGKLKWDGSLSELRKNRVAT